MSSNLTISIEEKSSRGKQPSLYLENIISKVKKHDLIRIERSGLESDIQNVRKENCGSYARWKQFRIRRKRKAERLLRFGLMKG